MTVQAVQFTLPFADMESQAAVYYASPDGQGEQDGSSPANSLPLSSIEPFVRDLTQTAKLVLLPGVYNLTSTLDLKSPSSSGLFVMEGQKGAILRGDFNFADLTGTDSGIRLRSGNVIVRGVEFENMGFCVKADKYSTVNQVVLEKFSARNVHSCILVDRDVQQTVTKWIVKDASIAGYYRVGVRLSGRQSKEFLLENLEIDGAHTLGNSDCYKAGIQLYRGVSEVNVKNVNVANNVGSCGENYQQGDGIEADHKDGTPRNIRFEKVRVSNSGDAEFDLKADAVTMQDVVALGGELSRYAFKVWTYDNYECTNCYAFGLNKAFINLNQANMRFRYATFANDKPVQVCDLRHGTLPEEQSVVQFEQSQVYVGNEDWMEQCGPGVLAGTTRLPEGKIAPPSPVEDVRVN